MKNRNAYKRPCDQCRRSYSFAYERGEYASYETVSGVAFRVVANCCGEWVITFPADTKKLGWRRP